MTRTRKPHRAGPGPIRVEASTADVVSDVHGCLEEFEALLSRLGYEPPRKSRAAWRPPAGRRLVIAGDVVDRGPAIPALLRVVMAMVEAGDAVLTVGNHDDKLRRALRGNPVRMGQGLEASLEQLGREASGFRKRVLAFLESLPSHALVDDGRLVVAHAGLPEDLHGASTPRARDVAMFGIVEPGVDEWGLPIRIDWAASYRGEAYVVYGHTPVVEPVWRNRTIDIDTGCVFGGSLTAVRYPELDVVSVPAARAYQAKGSPFRMLGPGGPPVPDASDSGVAVATAD